MRDAIKIAPTLAMLRERRAEIIAITEAYKAFDVRAFGSVAREEATPESDIDFLVDFAPGASLYDMSGLKQTLQELLGYRVDIVEIHARTKERFKRNIMSDVVSL